MINHELTSPEDDGKNSIPQVAFIQLKGKPIDGGDPDKGGEPYQREIAVGDTVERIDCNRTADHLARETGYITLLPEKIREVEGFLDPLFKQGGFDAIDDKLKHGKHLTFNEAFSTITFVCAALNKPLRDVMAGKIQNLKPYEVHRAQATGLLYGLSYVEGFVGLPAEEIAGLVAATIHLDTFVRTHSEEPIISFGGMGGDKGYPLNGENSKLFSLSTLSAIALAVDGPVHKHHSYPNTSKVAGQSAIEAFGARSDFHSPTAFDRVLQEANLLMTSCHDTRTLHTLSHFLKGETINHIIGPLSFTLSSDTPIQAMIGVNEKIHPERITEALMILTKKGFQKYDAGAVFCGTDLTAIDPTQIIDSLENKPFLTEHIRLDEVAPLPYISLVAFCKDGENLGTYILSPEDFYPPEVLSQMSLADLEIPNSREDILSANDQALTGQDINKARYLAMTIGLGLFVRHFLGREDALDKETHRVNRDYLRTATARGLEILTSGEAKQKLDEYVQVTQRYAGGRK